MDNNYNFYSFLAGINKELSKSNFLKEIEHLPAAEKEKILREYYKREKERQRNINIMMVVFIIALIILEIVSIKFMFY